MAKDLEYQAAHNFMFSGYYDYPGIELPGPVHAYDQLDAAWDALAETAPKLVENPQIVQALAQTIDKNIAGAAHQASFRRRLALKLSDLNQPVDRQG